VNLFAHIERDKVVVEGYFSGKAKAVDCVVEVMDPDGNKLREGRTDANGMYSFRLTDLPRFSGDLRIALQAGSGHRAEYTVSQADLPASLQRTGGDARPVMKRSATQEGPVVSQPPLPSTDAALMKKAVEEALDDKIAPLVKMLGEQQRLLLEQKTREPSLTEIVGGIGWILGIVGIAAYFMSLRRKSG
jgi:nickel transport protein